METIKKIRKLMSALPEKDYNLGIRLLDNRDFESLQSIINSNIYKIKKKYSDDEESQLECTAALSSLESLKMEVDDYAFNLDIPRENYEDYFIDYE